MPSAPSGESNNREESKPKTIRENDASHLCHLRLCLPLAAVPGNLIVEPVLTVSPFISLREIFFLSSFAPSWISFSWYLSWIREAYRAHFFSFPSIQCGEKSFLFPFLPCRKNRAKIRACGFEMNSKCHIQWGRGVRALAN